MDYCSCVSFVTAVHLLVVLATTGSNVVTRTHHGNILGDKGGEGGTMWCQQKNGNQCNVERERKNKQLVPRRQGGGTMGHGGRVRESRGVRISVSRDVRMCEQGCEKVRAGCENR